jgi:hypothetical protein
VRFIVHEPWPDLVLLRRGEVDLAYLPDAPMAEEVKQDPKLRLVFSGGIATYYLD